MSISGLLAGTPVAIWIYLLFSKSEKSKKTVAFVFLLGCLTAPTLLIIQQLWSEFPSFNLAAFIENNVKSQATIYIATFVLFGAMEEIIKQIVVILVDRKTLLIKTVGDSMRYSIASALGFSFIENSYYLMQFWPSLGLAQVAGMFIFRAIFTTCAHMIFSGIFGYHYGIGKFAIDISQQEAWVGKVSLPARIVSKIFKMPVSQAYQQEMIIKGMLFAIWMHASFNYLLELNIILPIIGFVLLGYAYLRFLLSRKTGNLMLVTDISTKKKSTLIKKDEDVVLELVGMWFKDKRYVDVIHICERLLERDPDNNVIKLFKAKAVDAIDQNDTYAKILGSVLKTKDDISANQRNILTTYLDKKEQLRKSAVKSK